MTAPGRRVEAGRETFAEIQRCRCTHRPARRLFPMIHARGVGQGARNVRVGAPLQVVIEEGLHVFHAELIRGIAGKSQRAEVIAVVIHAGMAPRTDDQ